MGSIRVDAVGWRLPSGDELFRDVSFSVGAGERVALIGANGVGKTSLLRTIIGDEKPSDGRVSIDGRLGVMRQLVGMGDTSEGAATDVRGLLLSIAPDRIQSAAARLALAESRLADHPMQYADALAAWGDAGGYDVEVAWDEACGRTLGVDFRDVADRPLRTLSGGEQKRLALEYLFRSENDALVLDEPDNFLDVPAKRWLERELNATKKAALFVSHDRELLSASASKIVTIEAFGSWTHGGGFDGYAAAKQAHDEQRARDAALFDRERERLEELVAEMRRRAKISEVFAPRLKAAESRLRQFLESNERPPDVRDQQIDVRLRGARTGKRAVIIEQLELSGLTDAFDAELWYGERVAVLGGNGAGKSHFLRLLAGDEVDHEGSWRLGANVTPGLFHQTHEHPEWVGRTPVEILHDHDVVLGPAMGMLRRYEIHGCAHQPFETMSGGQQARFQILLLEISGATLLLLDEPTDNLDLVSAEALEHGLDRFDGTVIAVTHDRWFLRGFDRYLVFEPDCTVTDHDTLPDPWH
ncbi:MAG: ATP-binding cassette domain-containing protein [Ilumatobacter fluminis]|uniref:ABC-F family ATP-binding cassette domain-containing protein n=1 Tax=Ilumatobacter fluminis TaxID=467091 RepID=UPI0032EC6ECA